VRRSLARGALAVRGEKLVAKATREGMSAVEA
jgi:hypothetical protein